MSSTSNLTGSEGASRILRVGVILLLIAGAGAWLSAGGTAQQQIKTQAESLLSSLSAEPQATTPARSSSREAVSAALVTVESLTLTSSGRTELPRLYTGVLRATRSSRLGFKTQGRVDRVLVDEGDRVTKGQLLAQLDTRLITARLRVLESQRDSANALLDELKAGPRAQTIKAARAEAAASEAMVAQAQSTFDRMSRLVSSDSVARQEYDDSTHQLEAAKKQLDAKLAVLDELEEGTRPEKIAAQLASVKQLEAEIASVEIEIEDANLKAPFDAVIADRVIDEGVVVQPGSQVLKLIEDKPLEAWVGLPVAMARSLAPGKQIAATIEGAEYRATLKTVLPELDAETRTQMAVFDLESPGDAAAALQPGALGLAVGQLVQVSLSQPIKETGFWLPISALTRDVNGLWSAFVLEREEGDEANLYRARRTDLQVLQVDSSHVLVRGLIQEGDQVVSAGVQKLSVGQLVRAINRDKLKATEDIAEEAVPDTASRS